MSNKRLFPPLSLSLGCGLITRISSDRETHRATVLYRFKSVTHSCTHFLLATRLFFIFILSVLLKCYRTEMRSHTCECGSVRQKTHFTTWLCSSGAELRPRDVTAAWPSFTSSLKVFQVTHGKGDNRSLTGIFNFDSKNRKTVQT